MELYELTLYELMQKLRNREISSRELLDSYLSRIKAVDGYVQAFITLCEEYALEKAGLCDKKGEYQGITGIPYALKDLICTRGVRTTCGSKTLENFVPMYDATVARRLAEANGILLGKLNMDEFAMGSSTELSYFFPTRNPWDLDRVPGGSSGGSAAAVAADEVPFSLGSDSGGSVRQPASFCGVVGLKPTYGRVSRWGVVAYASSFDQVGTITKDVRDCAIVMNIIAGADPLDSTSVNIEVPDYKAFLQTDVKGLKIAFPRECFSEGVDKRVRETIINALKKFEAMGADVEEVSLPNSQYALPAYYLAAPAEASANLARFDGIRYGIRDFDAENVTEMFANSRSMGFGDEVKRRIMLGTYALSSGYYEAYYLKALKVRRLIKNDFDEVFKEYDLIISPTTPTTAFKIGEKIGDPLTLYMTDTLTVSVNMAGLPAMSIPGGFIDGLPVGMQLIGKPFDEGTLIKAAYTYEQNTDYHKVKPALEVKR